MSVEQSPFTSKEYYAFKRIAAVLEVYRHEIGFLEKRAKTVPGLYRDVMMLKAKMMRVMDGFSETIPEDKVSQINAEFKNTSIQVCTKKEMTFQKKPPAIYVPADALEKLVQMVLEWECWSCEKKSAEFRACPYRQTIESCFPFELKYKDGQCCKFSGLKLTDEEMEK